MAVEEIAGTEITEFAKWMRVLLGETARISSHFMGMGGFFNNLGLHTMGMWNMDMREYFLDFLESYSGARIATAAIEPGGVRYGLDMTMLDELQKALDKFDEGIDDVEMIFAKTLQCVSVPKRWGSSRQMRRIHMVSAESWHEEAASRQIFASMSPMLLMIRLIWIM